MRMPGRSSKISVLKIPPDTIFAIYSKLIFHEHLGVHPPFCGPDFYNNLFHNVLLSITRDAGNDQ
jgi:hypothetical protein